MIKIESVAPGSIAARHGIKAGDALITINGEKVIDNIDYQALTSARHVCIVILKPDGNTREVDIVKPTGGSLGLTLEAKAVPPPRECANNCLFCFVDQMPCGMRPSLYIKDDDWRYSLMMGNFITLTNVGDKEFERILKRRPSPLYISIHATNPEVRRQLLRNPHAGQIMDRLRALKERGIFFHCQLVLCPGMNDGEILKETLDDIFSLRPFALSAALVPVGLTKFRDNLPQLPTYTPETAQRVLDICSRYREKSLKEYGDAFVYPADEFICITSSPIPPAAYYDHFPQLENGIGMLRLMDDTLISAANRDDTPAVKRRRVCIPCGVSVAPYMDQWITEHAPDGVTVQVVPIKNRFFGETVTVTGLLTAQDILAQIEGIGKDEVLISESMLNSEKTVFLDDMTFEEFRSRLACPCYWVRNNGEALYRALCGADR